MSESRILNTRNLIPNWCLAVLLSCLTCPVGAAEFDFSSGGNFTQEEEFLPVDQAFALNPQVADGKVLLRWDIAEGYYLYRHQLSFSTRNNTGFQLGEAQIPAGNQKFDEYFGDVEVYYAALDVTLPIEARDIPQGEIGVMYQGCAEAGLCYPPEQQWFAFDGDLLLPVSSNRVFGGAASANVAEPVEATPPATASVNPAITPTEERALAGILANESLLYALGLFFLAGIGLAFTPCVLPMVPILSSIIVGEGEDISQRRAFSLSLAYVLGMAFTYAIIGVLVGLFGAQLNLQAALQSAPVLVFFALVFVVLSFSMFGFYELQLPQSWQNALNNLGNQQQGGKHASVLVMGSLSSLVVSPCVSAPLAGALIYISTTNDWIFGGGALLALGLGMGVPLLIVGASGGQWLPRAGAWMDNVKAVFGVLLLAVAVWLLERVVPAAVTLVLWGMLLLGSGVYLGVLDFSPRQGWGQFAKATGAFAFIWGAMLLIGAAMGAHDPLKPLGPLAQARAGGGSAAHEEQQWIAVKSIDDVQAQIAASNKPVILDLYADWCISCKVMERNVFPVPEVDSQLARFTLLRADVTANDAIDQALLSSYGLFGPPSFVFFAEDGREISEVRLQGELGAEAFAAHLQLAYEVWQSDNFGNLAAISP